AGIVAYASQPALSFDDPQRAQRNLNALQERASISAAALYTADGALFAKYVRPGDPDPPPRQPTHLTPGQPHIEGERVLLLRYVTQAGERLGSIYLRAEFDSGRRIRDYLHVLAAVMVIGLLAALFVSSWMQ